MDANMIGSKFQCNTLSLSERSQSSAGHISPRKSYTVSNDQLLEHENSSNRNSSFYFEDLSAEDEIYTFQCPENYINQNLFNRTFDFGKVNRVVDAKTSEDLQLSVVPVEKKSLTIALPKKGESGILVKLPLKGHILIKKVVKTPFHPHNITNEDNPTCEADDTLLKELKYRHPLLGINWKVHADLADEAFKRENERLKEETNKKLKAKQTKNHKRGNEFETEGLHLKKKRKME